MNDKRIKLDNALRRAMLQRSALKHRLNMAGRELAPGALLDRGKFRVGQKIDEASHDAQQTLQRYRLPLTVAAVAGIAYALRGPIQRLAPQLWDRLQSLTGRDDAGDEHDAGAENIPPPPMENDDETV